MEYEDDGNINCIWCIRNDLQSLEKGAGRIWNQIRRNYPNYQIIDIDQNTEKSSENLRRLLVTQTPVKDHQYKLVWKTRKE